MFKNSLTTTPLTTESANDYFGNKINGSFWARDYTFLTTLRALLDRRMKDGETLNLSFSDVNPTKEALEDMGTARALRSVSADWVGCPNQIHVQNFRSLIPENNKAWLDMIEENFAGVYEGWHRVEKVTAFFRKVFTVLCFINPELKSVLLFTEGMDIRRMHYLQCGIFAFIPWYFDPEAGVTELEMELINSLREKSSDKYEACIAKIAEQYDFETARIRKLLKGFETRYERIQRQSIQNDIDAIVRRLNDLDRQYSDYLRSKRDYENTLLGLDMKITQSGEDSEIMDYFLHNKQLVLEDVDGSSMQFVVKTTLDYFDEDLARRVIENNGSWLYQNDYGDQYNNGAISAEDMRLLMTEIFLNQSLRIRFCAAYSFTIGGSVNALSNYDYPASCREYMPNPHIDRYSCLGNYKRIINERLRENDYIGAIEQCVSSGKSLNFGDGAVMREFVSRVYGTNGHSRNLKFIEAPDGAVMNAREAVEWIKKQQEEG